MPTGKFVVLEGLDGSGITTQVEFLRTWCESQSIPVFVTKEPSEGPAGALIKQVLGKRLVEPNPSGTARPLAAETIALLFAADRFDHLRTEILPNLDAGIVVISDRYYLSSYAYQSLALDLGWVRQLNARCPVPDLTIFLDVPVELCLQRFHSDVWRSSEHFHLYEERNALTGVRDNYLRIIEELRREGHRIEVVDGSRGISEAQSDVRRLFESTLEGGGLDKPTRPNSAGAKEIAEILRSQASSSLTPD